MLPLFGVRRPPDTPYGRVREKVPRCARKDEWCRDHDVAPAENPESMWTRPARRAGSTPRLRLISTSKHPAISLRSASQSERRLVQQQSLWLRHQRARWPASAVFRPKVVPSTVRAQVWETGSNTLSRFDRCAACWWFLIHHLQVFGHSYAENALPSGAISPYCAGLCHGFPAWRDVSFHRQRWCWRRFRSAADGGASWSCLRHWRLSAPRLPFEPHRAIRPFRASMAP